MVEEKTIYTFDQPLTRYQFSDINLTIVSGYPPMSEDEPTPEPTPTPPEPEPENPTEITLSKYQNNQIETETVQLPVTFNVSTFSAHTIAKKTDLTYNIIIGAGNLTNNNGFTWANYTPSTQNVWYATTIGDFTFTQFAFYNISIPYLSTDTDLALGTDNINTITINSFKSSQDMTTLPTTDYTAFTWNQTHSQFYYFIYDKTDDILYATDTQHPVQIDSQHELYYCDDAGQYGYFHLKTTNGYISIGTADTYLDENIGRMKITNASKYFPSVTTL